MKILIVEDEINAREGLGNLLGKINDNYIVCGKASDGEQGLILAKEHKPDLIFTDIEMPRLNGLDMLEKIKEDGQNPYIIILSGYSDFKYAQKGIKIGVEEYLLKPITYSALKSSMEQIERKFNLEKEKYVTIEDGMIKEEILGQILLNKGKNLKDFYKIVKSKLEKEKNIYLVNLYLGDKYEEESGLKFKKITDFMEKYEIKVVYYSLLKEYRYLPILINTKRAFEELVRILKYNLLFSLRTNGFSRTTISVININDINEIGES